MPYLGLEVAKPAKPPKKKDTYVFLKTTADQVVTNEETDERLDELIEGGIVKRTDVVDNLESESPDLPLSARMGSELNKNLNVRYNDETDKIEIFYNGIWNEWKIAGLQLAYLFDNGEFNETFGTIKYNGNLLSKNIVATSLGEGFWVNALSAKANFSKLCFEYTLNVGMKVQGGVCTANATLPTVISTGAGRGTVIIGNLDAGTDEIKKIDMTLVNASYPAMFLGVENGNGGTLKISRVWFE